MVYPNTKKEWSQTSALTQLDAEQLHQCNAITKLNC